MRVLLNIIEDYFNSNIKQLYTTEVLHYRNDSLVLSSSIIILHYNHEFIKVISKQIVINLVDLILHTTVVLMNGT